MPGPYYHSQLGFNETITFNLDDSKTKIVGFNVEYHDKQERAKKIRKKSKRDEYLTPQFHTWSATAQLSQMTDAVLPSFERTAYDAMGGEVKTK